jgi:hypothetical protein
MLFLSQIYGEEEDAERRAELKRVLTNAVIFSASAQTKRGGWGDDESINWRSVE